ncbi:Serine hydrolase [Luteimonas sp. 9C]|uniref:serine hydrolase domain-containing protein n=1 Tax=Luteimonas sp. 9C TaxID=2653148 RepID=UPI0012EFE8E6|nr:serine hydrolase [Luteimonas sp. 9C]VXC21632.1 Serine hydrolase [Luteimonas sp. 9C]
MRLALLLPLLLLPAAVTAQDPTPLERERATHARAIAAGYKALTLCSVQFNAGRTATQAQALELVGIYPDYQADVLALDAVVDADARTVSVSFDDALPPRIAAWRPNLGCAQLPIGAGVDAIAALPRFDTEAPDLDDRPWPVGERDAIATPRGDAAALEAAVSAAFDTPNYGEGHATTGVIVLQDGRIVAERYRDGFGPHTSQRTWSVAKSLAGALVGVAQAAGALDPAQPAPVPEWQAPGDPRSAITIDQLLRMSSGLHSDTAGNRTDALYFGGATVAESATGGPLVHPPGTRFRYANHDSVLAVHALRAATGDEARALSRPFTDLFWPLGMTRTVAETDWRGGFVLSSQVWSTARDLARFGLLLQQDGMFEGRRLLPDGWVRTATTPSGPQPEGDLGYGATLWLMQRAPGVPADTFAAMGNRGQYVIVVPSRGVVLVRRGEDPTGKRFDPALFTAAVLAGLDGDAPRR